VTPASHCALNAGLKCNKCILRQVSNSKALDGQAKSDDRQTRCNARHNACQHSVDLYALSMARTMSRFRKPCLTCGQLGLPGDTLCPRHKQVAAEHERVRQSIRKAGRTLYTSAAYRRMAKAVRDTAEICHLCGLGAKPNDPWTADHIIAGNPDSPLAPAHRSCNSSRGNKPL